MQTIKATLAEAARTLNGISDSAVLDAEILLALTLNAQRSYLRAWPDRLIDEDHQQRFFTLLLQRQQGMPIAYLTGMREFWSREFEVTPDVLIPRPETELLVELSLSLVPNGEPARLLDLGTGSGIIAVTLAAERLQTHVTASDNSPAALRIAQRNAERHNVHNIRFYLSDWFAALPDDQFHLIVSNPPYIAPDDSHLQQGDLRFEPSSALCALEHGLSEIIRIADSSRRYLHPGGHLLIEHGYNQQLQVRSIFSDFDYQDIQTYFDLSGQPRATCGRKAA